MYQEDYFNPTEPNDYDNVRDVLATALKNDTGLNIVTRRVELDNGKIKNKRIKVFTSSGCGSNIRDAETGENYSNKVGSRDEDLFFKVSIATGECTSANGSNVLFYCSPQHYENHLHSHVDPDIVSSWEAKRDARLKELKFGRKPLSNTVMVK